MQRWDWSPGLPLQESLKDPQGWLLCPKHFLLLPILPLWWKLDLSHLPLHTMGSPPCLHSRSLLETPLRWGGTEQPPKSPAHTSLSLQPSMVRDPSPEWTVLAPGEGGWEARLPPQVSWSDLTPSRPSFGRTEMSSNNRNLSIQEFYAP